MAAAGDAPAGLFSGVWSRLRAAASVWSRRGQASGGDEENDEEEQEEEEAAVRSRLAWRAAAARRLGRKLAFVSFNLEVLVFVYAFWRARRRSLTWRLPTQALPILVIPALATLIYAAFVRFTRTLDLKDKKRLERLQEEKQQTDSQPREFDQNNQNKNSDGVGNASDSSVATDSVPHTPKLRKQRQSSINQRDDGGADMAWGHSKDFQPAPSGGLRLRRLSSAKTFMTNSSATERSEENAQRTRAVSSSSGQHIHVPISTEDTVSYLSDDHSRSAQPANIPQTLPAGDGEKEEEFDGLWDIRDTCSSSSKENLISPAGPHNSFCDRDGSRSSEHAVPYLSTAFQELLVKVNEEHSLSLPEKLEFSPVFIKEADASPPDNFVCSLNELSHDLSDPVPPASESLKELLAEGVKEKTLLEPHTSAPLQMYSFTSEDEKELLITSDVETYQLPPICSDIPDNAAIVNIVTVNPKWNLLLELYGNIVEETESSKFHIPEESTTTSNLEEVLLSPPSVSSIQRCLGTPESSLCSQETEKLEVAGSFSFIDDSQEFSFLSPPELVVEGGEDATVKELCELNTEENVILINMEEALQDPLLVSSTSEQCLEASDVSLCIQDASIREDFVTENPELMYPASPELVAEGDEDIKEDKTSDLHLPEQNGLPFSSEKEPILDSLVADTAEHLLVTSLYSEEVEITEVHDVVKEGIFESEGEEELNHLNLLVTPPDDDSNTQNLISDSIPVQFIPNTDINEALEGVQEAYSEMLHQSTCQSEEIFLSSVEINNDVVYSSNSNSYANVVEDEAPFADQEGLSKFEEEMPITFSDSPIFLDEVKTAAIVDSAAASPKLSLQTYLHGGGVEENESSKYHVPEEIRTPFNLEEEVLLSPLAEGDEDIKEDKMSGLHLPEQNGLPFNSEKEPILDSLVADTAEHLLVTPLYSEEVEITEVRDVVKEGIFESEGEEAFNHLNLVTSPDDDSNTQSLRSDSMPVQFIPNTYIDEALEGGQEPFSDLPHQSTCHSEEIFLSSREINKDEVYSSNSNSYTYEIEDEAPFVGQEGLPKFQEEMPITFSDSPIFLDEVKSAAIVDSDAASPKLSFQTDLHGGGVEENESSKYHVLEEIRTPFNLEEEVLLSPPAVNNESLFKQLKFICQSVETPESSLYNQESEEMEVAESVSFIKASPELSFLSSPELVAVGGEDAREKETDELNTEEENVTLINLEDETLQGELVVSATDQSLETSEFSLSSQDAKMTEVPGIVSSFTISPELKYPTFPELIAEGDEDLKVDETSDLHLHEEKGLPFNPEKPFLDPLVVDTAEDAVITSELLICSEEVKMTEVHGVVKEVLSESEDEGAFDHRKLVLTSSYDDNTAQNLISNSISAQFPSDASVKEASQAGLEALSEPPHEITCHSEGTFLSSGEINNDEVKFEAPFAAQEGLSKSADEMVLTHLATSILLDEVASAENLIDNSGSSQSISDSNQIQSLHDHERAPSETLQEVTSLLEGSHTSSDEGINSEIFSLYSRSSSCVSEINILETLRGGTTSEPKNDRDLSFDESSNPVTFPNIDSTESNTNDPVTAEFILETNMIGALNAAEEATVGSVHEDSSNFLGTFVAPDVINHMRESDKHLDLSSSSFAPVVDVFESLQTGQGFSELQYENDFTVQETPISPKEVNDAENYLTEKIGDSQDSERTSIVALLDEDLSLHRSYMSPEDVGNSLADDYGSDLHTVESDFFSEKLSPESQDPLSSEEILVYPDESSTAENDLGTANSPLCSTEVNLAESRGIDQEGTQQHDETMLGSEDIYMVYQEANAENLCNSSGSLDIPDVIMADSLQGADILSSEILYDGMSSFEGTLLSLDVDDNTEEDSPNNSGSVMHDAQTSTTSLLGLQEGSLKPEDGKAINSISPYEVDTEEAKDKEPKEDGESKDMKEDVEDMDDDHENNPMDTFGADEIAAALTPKPSVKPYANDVSWRDSAIGTSNDFDMAVRKPVVTIGSSNGSSTVLEPADVQYTGLVDDDTETVRAPLPSSVATETQSCSNDMTARVSVE